MQLILAVSRNTPLGRGALRRRVLRLLEKLQAGPVKTTFRRTPIILHLDNTTERKALLSAYDKRELDFLASFLASAPGTFVDVGANSGLYVQYLAARMRPGSKIVAVEPNSVMCERIDANLRLLAAHNLGLGVEIAVARCAAGAEDGYARLEVGGGFGAANLRDDAQGDGIEVPVRLLSDILRANGVTTIDAMKIDVEGYEDRVLMPFLSSASPMLFPRAIVIEDTHRSRWQADAIARLFELGYREAGRTRGNLFLMSPAGTTGAS